MKRRRRKNQVPRKRRVKAAIKRGVARVIKLRLKMTKNRLKIRRPLPRKNIRRKRTKKKKSDPA